MSAWAKAAMATALHGRLDHLAAGRRIVAAGEFVGVADRGDAAADACRLDAAGGFGGEKSGDRLGGRGNGRKVPFLAPYREPGEVLLVDAPCGGRLGSARKILGYLQVGRRQCGDRFAGLEGGEGIHR
jgi:hypothetical protein